MFAGETVRLRGLQEGDLGDLGRLSGQAAHLRTLRVNGAVWPGEVAEARALLDRTITDPSERYGFAVEAIDDARFVGIAAIVNLFRPHNHGEVLLELLEDDAARSGVAVDALRLVARFGFGQLGLHRLAVQVRADAPQVLATFTDVGFQEEARFREEALDVDGGRVDVLQLSLLEHEWREVAR